jgi:hypothetical protein
MFNVFDIVRMNIFGLKEYGKYFPKPAPLTFTGRSGPTLFTLLRDDVKAGAIHKKLQEKGLETYLADF